MKEYIERELLLIGVDGCISALHTQAKGDPIQEGAIKLVEATRDYIASLSAADVAPVRHGRWERNSPDDIVVYCSQCMMPQDAPSNYCPSCGALMDKEADNEVS